MKKIALSLFVSTSCVFSLSALDVDFIDCTSGADNYFEDKETKITKEYKETLAELEASKEKGMKEAFTFSRLRQSMLRLQEARTTYKKKVSEAEAEYKKTLLNLKEEHNKLVADCSLEKKPFTFEKEIAE